jgi:hypothetical protein
LGGRGEFSCVSHKLLEEDLSPLSGGKNFLSMSWQLEKKILTQYIDDPISLFFIIKLEKITIRIFEILKYIRLIRMSTPTL